MLRTPDPHLLTAEFCLAVMQKDFNKIKEILSSPDFDPNLKTNAGYSPLYYVIAHMKYDKNLSNPDEIAYAKIDLLNKLVALGANLHAKYDGLTLGDIARHENLLDDENSKSKSAVINQDVIEILDQNNVKHSPNKLTEFKKDLAEKFDSSQAWVKSPMKKMKYTHQSRGFCFGVAHMGIQAMVLDERDEHGSLKHFNQFDARVQHLRTLPGVKFQIEIENARQKRILLTQLTKDELSESGVPLSRQEQQDKIESLLTREEKLNLEMQPFMDGVNLYHTSARQSFLKSDKKLQANINPVKKIVSTPALEAEGGMVAVHRNTGVYDEAALTKMLAMIQQTADKSDYKAPISLALSANGHAISIGYDPVNKEWIFIDANLERVVKFAKPINTISSNVFKGLFGPENHDKLLLKSVYYASVANGRDLKEQVIEPLTTQQEWKDLHQITKEKLAYRNEDGISLMDAARHNFDGRTLHEIKVFKHNKVSNSVENNRVTSPEDQKQKVKTEFKKAKNGFFDRNKKKLGYLLGGVLVGALLIAASVLTGGIAAGVLVGVGTVIGIGTLGSFGAKLAIDEKVRIEENQLIKKHLAGDKELQTELAESDKFKEKKIKCSTSKVHQTIASESSELKKVDKPLSTEKIDSYVKKQFSQLDATEREKFIDGFFKLNEDKRKAYMSTQTEHDLLTLKSSILPHDKKEFDNLKKLIDNYLILMQPYNHLNAAQRAEFRSVYLSLPPEQKQSVLLNQSNSDLERLSLSINRYKKSELQTQELLYIENNLILRQPYSDEGRLSIGKAFRMAYAELSDQGKLAALINQSLGNCANHCANLRVDFQAMEKEGSMTSSDFTRENKIIKQAEIVLQPFSNFIKEPETFLDIYLNLSENSKLTILSRQSPEDVKKLSNMVEALYAKNKINSQQHEREFDVIIKSQSKPEKEVLSESVDVRQSLRGS